MYSFVVCFFKQKTAYELRISDWSSDVCSSDLFGNPRAFMMNAEIEFERNKERYAFLRWGQQAFKNFRVVPPNTGIVHQVNLEYLAQIGRASCRERVCQYV